MQTWNYGLSIEKSWIVKQDGKQYNYLSGYASDSSIDRDGDRMSPRALKSMQEAIAQGMNLFTDHNHGWQDTIGVITKAENRSGYLWIEAKLENPEINKNVALLLHKMEIGEKIGLSIGGDMNGSHWEEDKSLGKKVRVIEDVKLYEVSVVGLPSNPNSYLLGSTFKSFGSVFKAPEVHKMSCGLCRNFHEVTQKLLKEIEEAHDFDEKAAPVAIGAGSPMGYREGDVLGPSTQEPIQPSSLGTPSVLDQKDEGTQAQLTMAHETVKALSNYIVKAKAETVQNSTLKTTNNREKP